MVLVAQKRECDDQGQKQRREKSGMKKNTLNERDHWSDSKGAAPSTPGQEKKQPLGVGLFPETSLAHGKRKDRNDPGKKEWKCAVVEGVSAVMFGGKRCSRRMQGGVEKGQPCTGRHLAAFCQGKPTQVGGKPKKKKKVRDVITTDSVRHPERRKKATCQQEKKKKRKLAIPVEKRGFHVKHEKKKGGYVEAEDTKLPLLCRRKTVCWERKGHPYPGPTKTRKKGELPTESR